jgi:hypothetical protein
MTPSRDDAVRPRPASEPAATPPDDDAILITDLAPRDDVSGGSGKLRLGEEPPRTPTER